jgi:DNA-binding MarR family transcriptional regulator
MNTDEPWLTDEQQRVWRTWLEVTALMPVVLHAQLQADSALSFPDFEVLSELSEVQDRPMRVNDLARALRWERSRLSHHIKRMQGRGLVQREECEEDARGALVVLTQLGFDAVTTAAPGHVRCVRTLMFDPPTPGDFEAFARVLEQMAARLQAAAQR